MKMVKIPCMYDDEQLTATMVKTYKERLVELGYSVKIYFIGEGATTDEEHILLKVDETHMIVSIFCNIHRSNYKPIAKLPIASYSAKHIIVLDKTEVNVIDRDKVKETGDLESILKHASVYSKNYNPYYLSVIRYPFEQILIEDIDLERVIYPQFKHII